MKTGDGYKFIQVILVLIGSFLLASGANPQAGLAVFLLVISTLLIDIRASILAKEKASQELGISDH